MSRYSPYAWVSIRTFIVTVLLNGGTAFGATITWTGGGDGTSWNQAANWDLGRIPAAGDDVVIDLVGTYTVNMNVSATIGSLTLGAGSGTQTLDMVFRTLTLSGPEASSVGANGVLRTRGSSTLTNTGSFGVGAGGTIRVEANDGAGNVTLTVANGFTNAGTIELVNTFFEYVATLNVANSTPIVRTVINTGEINALAGGSGSSFRTLGAEIDNRGTMNIQQNTEIINNGLVFTSTEGTVNVAGGRVFNIRNGETRFGSGTQLLGTGIIQFVGTATLALTSDFTHQPGCAGPRFHFGGTVTVAGPGRLTNEGTLQLTSDTVNAPLTNRGLLHVYYGSTIGSPAGQFVNEAAGTCSPTGVLRVEANDAAGSVTLTVANGFTNAGTIELVNTSPTVAFVPTLNITSVMPVERTLVNTGTINMLAGGPDTSIRTVGAEVDNQGTINVQHDGAISNTPRVFTSTAGVVNVASGKLLRITSGETRVGSGTQLLGGGTIDFAGANTLTLASDLTHQPGCAGLRFTFGGGVTVAGPGRLVNEGTLELTNDTINAPLTNRGMLLVSGGGTIGSPAGQFVNEAAGTCSPTGVLRVEANDAVGHVTLTVANGFTNAGTIELVNTSATLAYVPTLNITSVTPVERTLVNTGTINMLAGGPDTSIRTVGAEVDNRGTIQVDHRASINKVSAQHVNQTVGVINVSGGNLTVTQSGTTPSFRNNGVLNVAAGRTLDLGSAAPLTNFSGTTLAGGTYIVAGTLRFQNANIVTNGASITLDGPASAILNAATSANGIAGLAEVTEGARFTITNGRNLSTPGALTNGGGSVTVGPGSTLTVGGNYNQVFGSTTLDDGTIDPANLLDLGFGELRGNGTVAGDVSNDGVVKPGLSAGCLWITGNYFQSAMGTLEIEKAGANPCPAREYDRLIVTGIIDLDGELVVSLLGGYQPPVGTTFDIVTGLLVLNQFSTHNLPVNFTNDCKAFPVYGGNFVRLVAVQGGLFTEQPQSRMICAGDPVTFSVAVTGEPPFTYQWRKDGQAIPGATSSTLVIDPVTLGHAGDYDCVATNICGPRFSAIATLTVHVAPSITQHPASATRCEGEGVTFSVTATGVPASTYQWRHNGVDIPGAVQSTYSIAAVSTADAGNYTVVVTNPCGSPESAAATLTVNVAPVVTEPPAPVIQCEGRPATFSVSTAGTPPPTYQWRKDGVNLPGATGASYQIAAVTMTHAGSYDVVVTNVCGSVTSSAAALTVWPTGGGDVNGDGRTDGLDIRLFLAEVLNPGGPGRAYCAADMNGDRALDPLDVPLFVARLVGP